LIPFSISTPFLLSQLPYELAYTPEHPKPGLFEIRDEKDYPVLYSAITEDVDVFITGDRDFDGLDLEKPEINLLYFDERRKCLSCLRINSIRFNFRLFGLSHVCKVPIG
jgi:hypothetical protein